MAPQPTLRERVRQFLHLLGVTALAVVVMWLLNFAFSVGFTPDETLPAAAERPENIRPTRDSTPPLVPQQRA
ncbi:MAG: hypothetical protein REI09_13005 [Candidatus Dactylopiibacterium sp.]|nr:hypothetical protein [Candidatus Dactylopiibacterium sp.]